VIDFCLFCYDDESLEMITPYIVVKLIILTAKHLQLTDTGLLLCRFVNYCYLVLVALIIEYETLVHYRLLSLLMNVLLTRSM